MSNNKTEPVEMHSVANSEGSLHDARSALAGAWDPRRPPLRWLLRRMLHAIGDPPVTVRLWTGEELTTSVATPVARLVINRPERVLRFLTHPELEFGDAYSTGRLEVEGDLVRFLEAVYRAKTDCVRRDPLSRWIARGAGRARTNSLSGSRDNIHRHYDVGNDFYRLWLDPQLVYTCAYYARPDMTLEQAQWAKLDYVCRKLRLRAGEQVVEAGCGWGALALHMARHYGVSVKAYNVSHQQIVHARERARAEGLDRRVEFIEDDYRTIDGKVDAFVSVGMLEHVGVDHYRELGAVMHRALKRDGRGLIHTIGRDRACRMNAWIEKRIFPGAYPPTLREMMELFEPWSFSVLDVENLRLHYELTLRHWLARYERAADQITEMFDAEFYRTWRLYLAGSVAAFSTGSTQLFQVVFSRPGVNEIPLTRAHLYAGDPDSPR